jgi:hypothetical protein
MNEKLLYPEESKSREPRLSRLAPGNQWKAVDWK